MAIAAIGRRLGSRHLILASHNAGKVREFEVLLRPYDVDLTAASGIGLPEPEETGDSFAANAALKARAASRRTDMPALADDSGLCVAGLDGAPGIHSARWGGPERNFARAMAEVAYLLRERHGDPDPESRSNPAWRGRFVCALALSWPDGHVETAEGAVDGCLVWPLRGAGGFGYDPMFLPDGSDMTFAQMSPEQKLRTDHRAAAFAQLAARCLS